MASGSLNVTIRREDGTWITPGRLSGIRFTKTAPGGCLSAEVHITDADWIDGLRQGAIVQISQCTNANVVFTGLLKSDGLSVDGGSKNMTLDIAGTSQLLGERSFFLPYAVRDLDMWVLDGSPVGSVQGAQLDVGTAIGSFRASDPGGQVLSLTLPSGSYYSQANKWSRAVVNFVGMKRSGMLIQAVSGRVASAMSLNPPDYSGKVTTDDLSVALQLAESSTSDDFAVTSLQGNSYYNQARNFLPEGVDFVLRSGGLATTSPQIAHTWGDVTAPNNPNYAWVEIYYPTVGKGARQMYLDDTQYRWVAWSDLVVYGRALTRLGDAWKYDPGSAGGWLPHHIVEDLLWRCCPWATKDDQRSFVDRSETTLLSQFDYGFSKGAATPQQVLDDLIRLCPNHYYVVGTGRSLKDISLSWRRWPTTARYQAKPYDVVYDAEGSQQDLVTEICGRWSDGDGKQNEVRASVNSRPMDFPDAMMLGRTKTMDVDLGSSIGSRAEAQKVVNKYLDLVAKPVKSATATIDTLILDSLEGSMVEPSAIEPGYLMFVPETGESLRINEVSYEDDSYTATVRLASPSLSLEQLIAGVGAKHLRR